MHQSIPIKTSREIKLMQSGGQKCGQILNQLVKTVQPGLTTLALNQFAEQLCRQFEVTPAFRGFHGYQYSLVTCLNEEVVHGLPSPRKLQEGDLLTLDFGVLDQGYYTDTATTLIVGNPTGQVDQETEKFLSVGKNALDKAIRTSTPRHQLGDIGHAIQSVIEQAGYSVVQSFVGHGIGRELHEPPQVLGFGQPHTEEQLEVGMVLAIEVMYSQGSGEVEILKDGWTAVTKDGSLSAVFEHTVAITAVKPLVLTKTRNQPNSVYS